MSPSLLELFEPILEHDLRARYFARAAAERAPVYLWVKGKGSEVQSHVIRFPPAVANRPREVLMSISPENKNALAALTRSNQKHIYFRVNLRQAIVFGTLSPGSLKRNLGEFSFPFPARIYKVQRRSSARLILDQRRKIRCGVGEKLFNVLNLSSTGLAFLVPRSGPTWSRGDKIKVLHLNFERFYLYCQVEVRWKKLDAVSGAATYGVKFLDLGKAQTRELQNRILQEIWNDLIPER